MDPRFRHVGLDVRMVRLQPWKLWLLAAVGGALALTLAIAVASLFLVLVPVLVVGGLIAKFVLGGAPTRRAPDPPGVIEGHYEVLDLPRDRAQS
jgi:hypothetical protein